jgi:hypothetical protein
MSKVANFVMSLSIVGDGTNFAWVPATNVGSANSPFSSVQISLISGTVSQAIPAGASGFVFVPNNPFSTFAKSMKFNVGDVGGAIATALASPYDWEGSASAPTTVWFTGAGTETGTLYFF